MARKKYSSTKILLINGQMHFASCFELDQKWRTVTDSYLLSFKNNILTIT